MMRGILSRIGIAVGVLALLVGMMPALTSAQEATDFAIDGGWRILSLSPDGTLVAAADTGAQNLGVFAVPSGEEVARAALGPAGITLNGAEISWAPDSSGFVFAEAAITFGRDSDLWLFDVVTGELTNLTDDGFNNPLPPLGAELPAPITIDIAPSWSPDGNTIAFSRSTLESGVADRPTSLYTLDVASGETTELALFDPELPFSLAFKTAWSPDSGTIYASAYFEDATDERSGIWAFDAATGEATQLAGRSESFNGAAPIVTAVSPAGDTLVVSYPEYIGSVSDPGRASGYALLDPGSGDIAPIEPAETQRGDHAVTVAPNFAPGGSHLIFGVRRPSEREGFVVSRSIADGGETTLATLPEAVYPVALDPAVPVQIGGGIVLVSTGPTKGVLVDLPESVISVPVVAENDSGVVTVGDRATVLRATPGRAGAILIVLRPGDELESLGAPVEAEGHTWVTVRVPASGLLGYVRADFLLEEAP